MNFQNLIIYNLKPLFNILEEINLELNFKITFIEETNSLKNKIKETTDYLILSNKKYSDINNLFVLNNFPINIFKLIEKINIEFLKLKFNSQSQIKLQNYKLDLNSREIRNNKVKLKLTEKEINTIIFLSKSKNPVSINELQESVWGYKSHMETHTVETHIHRLRKKILTTFNDSKLIVNNKNGYRIEQN